MTDTTPADREQGTHFWFMTVQIPGPGNGFRIETRYGDITPGLRDTRTSLYRLLLDQIDPTGNVLAFDIQPNQL